MRLSDLRFTIARMMGIILTLGIGLAAFRYPSKLWASFLFSATIVVLVFASLGAFFHRGLPRTFWAGFAICGWFYLLMNFGPWFESEVSPYLFTTACLDLIYPHIAAPEQTAMLIEDIQFIGLAGGFGGGPAGVENPWQHWTTMDNAASGFAISNAFSIARSKPFQLIGHALFTLIFAYLGATIARWFARQGAMTVPAAT